MKTETPITLAQALESVASFDAMAFFPQVSAPARVAVAKSLLRLVNFKCKTHPDGLERGQECTCERRGNPDVKRSPEERLRLFTDGFLRVPGGWPGIGEMEAIYCMMFPPGDGIERDSPTTPGYTFADNESGTHVPLLPPDPEPEYKLLPGEELTEEERKQLAGSFASALAHVVESKVGVDE